MQPVFFYVLKKGLFDDGIALICKNPRTDLSRPESQTVPTYYCSGTVDLLVMVFEGLVEGPI
jgi:hypothetical protein